MSRGPDDLLEEAFRRARLDLPSDDQMHALAARLPMSAAPPGAPSAPATGSTTPLATSAVGATLAKAGLALVIAGAVAGTVAFTIAVLGYRAAGPGPASPGRVVPRSGPAAPDPAAPAHAAAVDLRPRQPPALVPSPRPSPRSARAPRAVGLRRDPKRSPGAPLISEAFGPPSASAPGSASPAIDLGESPVEVAPPATTEPDEIVLLLAAQGAVATDPGQAFVLAEEHRRRFAVGELVQERELIAIDALTRLGRRQDARERVRAFRRRFPDSAHLDRLENLEARVRR